MTRVQHKCIVAATAVLFVVCGVTTLRSASGPRLVVQRMERDFGALVQGVKVRHTFSIFNKGDEPLRISSVTNECPCFRVISLNKVLGIDGEGKITVEIDTTGMEGPLYLAPVIRSNDPGKPKSHLRVRADIQGPVALLPKSHFALTTVKGDDQSVRVIVKNNRRAPLVLKGVESTHPAFQPRMTVEVPGQRYRIDIALNGKRADLGHNKGMVRIRTDAPERPELAVNLDLLVQPSVIATPETLHLPIMTEAEAQRGSGNKTWSLDLQDLKGRPFQIVGVKAAEDWVRVSAKAARDGKSHELLVGLNPNTRLKPGMTRVPVIVITNLPSARQISIPVMISVRAPQPSS
jgi:uncharacterized protein DUF1573